MFFSCSAFRGLPRVSLQFLACLLLGPGAFGQPCVRWIQIQRSAAPWPGDRAGHAMAYDTDRGVTVFFGGDTYGSDDSSFYDDTWEYNGTNWTRVTLEGPSPSRRSNAAMAYDPSAHRMVLVGGDDPNGFRKDVWFYTSTGSARGRWDQAADLPRLNLPSTERTGATLTFDERLQRLVLIGGLVEIEGDPYTHGDVAVFDDGTWKGYAGGGSLRVLGFLVSSVGRDGLAWHAAAYDPNLQNIVIYSGWQGCAVRGACDPYDGPDENPFALTLHDEIRNGSDLNPSNHPGNQQSAMVYDTDRHRFVIFGGFNDGDPQLNPFPPFYELIPGGASGVAYLHNKPFGVTPERRWRHKMIYDQRRKRVVLYGGAGSGKTRFSDTWELVASAPVILQQPAYYHTNCAGSSFTLTVPVQVPPIGQDWNVFQWEKDGVPVPGATTNSITFNPITTADAGNYLLRIVNRCGVGTNTGLMTVIVHDKPSITRFDSTRKERCPGESATFTCDAVSTLPMRFQWERNGFHVPGATNRSLTLGPLLHQDSGDYRVRVSNDCGETLSASAHLQVGVTLLQQPQDTAADVCRTAGFGVLADGVGPLRYQWRLDGVAIESGVYFAGASSPSLLIQPLLYTHEGDYDVIVTDTCGQLHAVTSRVAKLVVKPGAEWFLRTTNGPAARQGHAIAYDPNRGVSYLFGGQRYGSGTGLVALNDLWQWTGSRWRELLPATATNGWVFLPAMGWQPAYQGKPVQRHDPALTYDSRRARLLLFGGTAIGPDGSRMSGHLGDLWEWDGANWSLRTTNGPAPRGGAAFAYDEDRGVAVLHAGEVDGVGPASRTLVWEWDGESWTAKAPTAGPSARFSQDAGSMAYDTFRHRAVFGPGNGGADLNEGPLYGWAFWGWTGLDWELLSNPLGLPFNGLQYGALVFDSSRRRSLWFGGSRSALANVTGSFDGSEWSLLSFQRDSPAPRRGHAMAYDSNRRATLMFGGDLNGFTPYALTNDTWELVAVDVPLINTQPASQFRRIGEAVAFSVDAVGPGDLRYQWFRDGQRLDESPDVTGTQSRELRFARTSSASAGSYRVRILNDCGETWSETAVLAFDVRLQILSSETTSRILWSIPGARLEQATDINGPWSPVPGAESPFDTTRIGAMRFFRLHLSGAE